MFLYCFQIQLVSVVAALIIHILLVASLPFCITSQGALGVSASSKYTAASQGLGQGLIPGETQGKHSGGGSQSLFPQNLAEILPLSSVIQCYKEK